MEPTTATLIVAGLGIGGTFGSGFLAQRMARKSARQQWLMDSRKEEFRELLAVLTKSFATICDLWDKTGRSEGQDRKLREAGVVALRTIRDRIYISEDMKRLDIYKIWQTAVREFDDDHVYIAFAEKYALINAKIVAAATAEK
jgi:hypothetical protein